MFRPSFTPTARGAMPNLNCQKAQHDDDNADVDGDANDGHDNDDVDNDRVVLIIMAIMFFIAIMMIVLNILITLIMGICTS